MCWELFGCRCNELVIKINYLFGDHMFGCKAISIIFWNESSELVKLIFKSVDCLDAFDLHGDYRNCEAFLVGSGLGFAMRD